VGTKGGAGGRRKKEEEGGRGGEEEEEKGESSVRHLNESFQRSQSCGTGSQTLQELGRVLR